MAVSLFYGMTESGKTSLAKKMLAKIKRSIVFDFTGKIDFPGATILVDFSADAMVAIFSKFKDQTDFKLIFRPGGIDIEEKFNKVALLSLALGKRAIQKGIQERLRLLIDEADFVCTPQYQSKELKLLINVGRHDGVDTWLIARMPQRLHTDPRGNASTVFCFRLVDDSAIGFVRKSIGKTASDRIRTLEQYSFLCWKDNGECVVVDKNGKVIESWR